MIANSKTNSRANGLVGSLSLEDKEKDEEEALSSSFRLIVDAPVKYVDITPSTKKPYF